MIFVGFSLKGDFYDYQIRFQAFGQISVFTLKGKLYWEFKNNYSHLFTKEL